MEVKITGGGMVKELRGLRLGRVIRTYTAGITNSDESQEKNTTVSQEPRSLGNEKERTRSQQETVQ